MSNVDDRDGDPVTDELADDTLAAIADEQSIADAAGELADDEPGSPAESLRGLISYLVENLVDDPSAVEINAEQHGAVVQLTVHVPEEELGKVIGRGGRIAKAMRTALMIAATRHHMRVSLDIEGKAEIPV